VGGGAGRARPVQGNTGAGGALNHACRPFSFPFVRRFQDGALARAREGRRDRCGSLTFPRLRQDAVVVASSLAGSPQRGGARTEGLSGLLPRVPASRSTGRFFKGSRSGTTPTQKKKKRKKKREEKKKKKKKQKKKTPGTPVRNRPAGLLTAQLGQLRAFRVLPVGAFELGRPTRSRTVTWGWEPGRRGGPRRCCSVARLPFAA